MAQNEFMSTFFDFSRMHQMAPRKGRVIVSVPFVEDDYFNRSVVMLCEHNEEGTFGFVINKQLEQDIHELIEDFPSFRDKICVGGPVDVNMLFFMHNVPHLIEGSIHITGDLYMGGDYEQAKALIQSNEIDDSNIKFFLGYAGWGQYQLEEELNNNSWFVTNVSSDNIMSSSTDNLWAEALENMGPKHKIVAKFPTDPSMN